MVFFDVVGVIDYRIVNVVPVPTFLVEAVDFVADSAGFETAFVQVVRTPLVDGQSEGQRLGEF